MSGLEFRSYEGSGTNNERDYHYSSAVRIGDQIQCSGQGGNDPETGVFYTEINAQIDQAFKNCDLALRCIGGKGFSQVFRINSYHVPLNKEAQFAMVRNFRKWIPDHKPLWTCVGVSRLGEDDMRVEIEVWAYDPK